MAWTADTRRDYVRPSGTYASDVTDREWALLAPLLPAPRPGGRPRTTCLLLVLNAIFYLLQAGCEDVAHAQGDEIAAAQLAVDRHVEEREVAQVVFHFEPDPDRPDVLRQERAFLTDDAALVQATRV